MIDIKEEYKSKLKGVSFIDLFCGIGGFRLALESFGANCLFSIDNNKQAVSTYDTNLIQILMEILLYWMKKMFPT